MILVSIQYKKPLELNIGALSRALFNLVYCVWWFNGPFWGLFSVPGDRIITRSYNSINRVMAAGLGPLWRAGGRDLMRAGDLPVILGPGFFLEAAQ